jgi:group I intron endonuclease
MTDASLKQGGIYCIRNIKNGKVYVGSAVKFVNRFSKHKTGLAKENHHSIKLQNAWNKYGESAFSFDILEIVCDIKILIAREQYWIDKYQSYGGGGYNMLPTAGSRYGSKNSDGHKKKISESMKGRERSEYHKAALRGLKRSEETRAKIVLSKIGNKSRLGIKLSDDTKTRMSIAQKAIVTPEKRAAISERLKGKVLSEDHKLKISESLKGRKLSAETREKMSTAKKGIAPWNKGL